MRKKFFLYIIFFSNILFFDKISCDKLNNSGEQVCVQDAPEDIFTQLTNGTKSYIKKSTKWTWSYKKVFTALECEKNNALDGVSFFKENTQKFSQLIFSWNATRPAVGGFSFFVKTQNSKNKKWSDWLKMFDWGSNFQSSYYSASENTIYAHVRLETGLSDLADAFKIVIKPHGGADLGAIKSVCACVSDFNKFDNEIIDDKLLALKSVYIKNVPKISQRLLNHSESARICSPTSCSMLVSYFNKFYVDPISFTNNVFDQGLGTNGSYGNWCFNVAELYCTCKVKILFYVERMSSFIDLHEKLSTGSPVVVSVRGKLDGGQKEYSSGHLILVVGFDSNDKTVICHDPAFYTNESVFVKYGLETFLRGWEKSNRLAYVADFKS